MVVAIEWVEEPSQGIRLVDQTRLPQAEIHRDVETVAALVEAIQQLAVRGAPALGAAGALGVALALVQRVREGRDDAWVREAVGGLREARPTAVNLAWGVDRVSPLIPQGLDAVLTEARTIIAEDTTANHDLSRHGADWLLSRTTRRPLRAITHCNTGALATTAWGTAYGILHELHDRGVLELVYADETRPLLQGARLTSWELTGDGIPHVIQADGAATSTILRGLVDFAVIGADRITANGDTANKVGSAALALACQRAGIPFVVAAPSSTVDLSIKTGDDIVIEERPEDEVLTIGGVRLAPQGARAFNPAFDVTPHDLISAVVTERGVVEPATDPHPTLLARIAGRHSTGDRSA